MGLKKIKLGELIVALEDRNGSNIYGEEAVVGLSTQKEIIKTKADLSNVSLTSYKLFPPKTFAYVPDTSRRGEKMSMAYNTSEDTYLVSSISVVFMVKEEDILLSDYLFMYFNRPEFDRYSRFNSWGSAREVFSWDEMCDIEIELPSLQVQKKFVDVYNSMLDNQRNYERGLEDLKLVCDSYIEKLKKENEQERLGSYIIESDLRNNSNLGIDSVRGIATSKKFISTKADMSNVSLSNYKVVLPNQIAYVPDTSRRGDKISLGYNDSNESYLVSSISVVFGTNEEKLLPQYLMLFLTRSEFDRYTRFNSWGSARETFNFDDMCDVKIPIPDLSVQKAISEIFTVYTKRKEINERLKLQIKKLCPILIKGSLEEGE